MVYFRWYVKLGTKPVDEYQLVDILEFFDLETHLNLTKSLALTVAFGAKLKPQSFGFLNDCFSRMLGCHSIPRFFVQNFSYTKMVASRY